MQTSRRELGLLLPALLAARASAAEKSGTVLPSKCYPFEGLPVKKNAQNGNETRQVFTGLTHQDYPIDLHITTLQPGQMPHPAHTHPHEEMIMMHTGTLEVTIMDRVTKTGPGSVAYVNSSLDAAGKFHLVVGQAICGAKTAKAERRVFARTFSKNQAPTRATFNAAAFARCCRRVFASPL